MKKRLLVYGLFLLTLSSFVGYKTWESNKQVGKPIKLTVILVTFGNQDLVGKWQGEAAPYMDRMSKISDISAAIPFCEATYEGIINKQAVLLVISGSAKIKTTACVTNLLQAEGSRIKEVILAGISGFSPTFGEVPVMLGDVCINSAAFDFDRQYYSSDQAYSQVKNPTFWSKYILNPESQIEGSPALAKELFAAANKVVWPETTVEASQTNFQYHGVNRKPIAWSPEQCLEASSDLFWHDIKADARAREMGAVLLKKDQVIIASAMEAVPAGSVIHSWNVIYKTNIAFAYVRGASNFDRPSGNSDGKSSITKSMNEDSVDFAIQTAALPLFKMLEMRNN